MTDDRDSRDDDPAGAPVRPARAASVRDDHVGAVRDDHAAPVRPARAGSVRDDHAGSVRDAHDAGQRLGHRRRTRVSVAMDRALRVTAVVAVFGLGAAGLAQPASVLRGGLAWLAFLVFALAGWGAIVVRVARVPEPDVGQRAALGAAGYLAIAGPLLALGILTRPVVLLLVCVGFAGFAWHEATAEIALWHRVRDGLRFVRGKPALGAFVAALVVLAGVHVLGAIATLDRNPWDDDIAYTPLIKRLLDAGDLIEPFSFRRLGAYGGQTVLQALGAARGTLASVHLVDQGLGFAIVLLLTAGYARERRTQPLWLGLIALVLLVLPDTAINTASYWLGAAAFFALYRCLVREQWALVGLVGAATCTLRQNFLAPVVVLVAAVLISRLVALTRTMPRREAWQAQRTAWALSGGLALLVIVPWWIAAYRSSHTFLFPIVGGTWNHGLSIRPAVVAWTDELEYLLTSVLEPAPISVLPIVALALAFVVDHRRGRPLIALTLASALGIVFLVHGIVGSEVSHVWRYAFGFTTPLAIVVMLELGADDEARVSLAPLGRWIVLGAFVLQLAIGRDAVTKQLVARFANLREAAAIDRHGDPNARAEQRRYTAMQAALPVGAHVVVMLDDPAMLDYRRNTIANLDCPGLASPGPQLPAFAGAEPLRAYLVAQGYRYFAFVRSERSRYVFRREFWLWRVFTDAELYRTLSAYSLDAIDSAAELATTTPRLYDDDGLVVLDLAHPDRPATTRRVAGDEPTRRTAWLRELADREGVHDAWSLTSRADLRFESGVGTLRFVDGSIDDPKWFEVSHPREPVKRGTAILPLQRRVHLRVRGETDMRLALRGALALNTVWTHPRLDVSLDGELLGSAVAGATGAFALTVTVPRARLADGWHDVYLVFSSMADPDRDVRDLRIARLESVEWTPP